MPDDVLLEASFADELHIDSLAFMEILLEIENEWDITFSDEAMQISAFATVYDLVNYIQANLDETCL